MARDSHKDVSFEDSITIPITLDRRRQSRPNKHHKKRSKVKRYGNKVLSVSALPLLCSELIVQEHFADFVLIDLLEPSGRQEFREGSIVPEKQHSYLLCAQRFKFPLLQLCYDTLPQPAKCLQLRGRCRPVPLAEGLGDPAMSNSDCAQRAVERFFETLPYSWMPQAYIV